MISEFTTQSISGLRPRSTEWVKRLPVVLKAINSESVKITRKEAKEIKQSSPSYKRIVGLDEVKLPLGVKVRYLYAPEEDEGGEKLRATNPIWSLGIYDLSQSVVSAEQPVLYYLSEGAPKRGFAREEFKVVLEETELTPKTQL